MDRVELSNLAFLIRALVANPSQRTFDAAESNMEFGGSETFRGAIAVLRTLVEKLAQQDGTKEQLFGRLSTEAHQLARTQKPLEKSVGQALVWAMESAQNSLVHSR